MAVASCGAPPQMCVLDMCCRQIVLAKERLRVMPQSYASRPSPTHKMARSHYLDARHAACSSRLGPLPAPRPVAGRACVYRGAELFAPVDLGLRVRLTCFDADSVRPHPNRTPPPSPHPHLARKTSLAPARAVG
eukprot:scaffold102133_cov36-Tisochrysis_lutea.AAC.1